MSLALRVLISVTSLACCLCSWAFSYPNDTIREAANDPEFIACAFALENEQRLVEVCRSLFDTFPYATDVYRLYSFISRIHRGPRTWYRSGPAQKFIMRKIVGMDYAVLSPEDRKRFKYTPLQEVTLGIGKHAGNPEGIEDLNPSLLALYGHLMAMGGSQNVSVNYYLRALALVPDDPVVNICLATSYLGLGMKRNAVNRNYLFQQSIAFMQRYYEIRTRKGSPAIWRQEAEYNRARMWHALGLTNLALPLYQKCAEMQDEVRSEWENRGEERKETRPMEEFTQEAAYAIQHILTIGGDMKGARMITEKYLVM